MSASERCDDGPQNGRSGHCNTTCSGPTNIACDPRSQQCSDCTEGEERIDSRCVDTDGCRDAPCFAGVACTDMAAPGTGFKCGLCPEGFEGDGQTCVGRGSCADEPCFRDVECTDVQSPVRGFVCGACPAGYEGNGKTCTDVDGCEDEPCFPGVRCTDIAAPGGGFVCGACPPGYEGDGKTCVGIGKCKEEPCFPGVTCRDVEEPVSGYLCGDCPAGYEGDGKTCRDVNGCNAAPCFLGVGCIDVPAPGTGATCGPCPAGYEGDGKTCRDVNGCVSSPCFPGAQCRDVPAPGTGFACGACPSGYQGDGKTCKDVDGCAADPCFPGVACSDIHAPGTGATCGACPPGYEGNGRACRDVNGCTTDSCFPGVACSDVPAPGTGFVCGACPTSYEGDGKTCTNIDGCADSPCFEGVTCTDVPAPGTGATCNACPLGFEGDGKACKDIDGCASGPCFAGVQCSDVPAPGTGFRCGACPAGYEGTGSWCSVKWCDYLSISNGNVSCPQGTRFGQECTYACSAGYRLIGADTTRACQADRTWSGSAPLCLPVDCGTPDVGEGSLSCSSGTTYGSWCNLACDPGWAAQTGSSGAYRAGCTSWGTWSATFASCSVCAQGFNGPRCQYSNQDQCSGQGVANYDGSCRCNEGFLGSRCACSNAITCSGHGVADAACGCRCFNNSFSGHFTGNDCSRCVDGWAGSDCLGVDADVDRFASAEGGGPDCNDADPAMYPGAPDQVGNGVDESCDGIDGLDADRDGEASSASGGLDCQDQDYQINSTVAERVNDRDDNCNGWIDEGIDDDDDGFGEGWEDCNDLDPQINRGASDAVGNGVDDNCDGVDGVDYDRDTYASTASGGDDCDDYSSYRHPNATDVGWLSNTTARVRSWSNRYRPGDYTLESVIDVATSGDGKPHTLGRVYEFGRGNTLAYDASTLEEHYTAGCRLAVSGTDTPHVLCRDDLRNTLIYRTRSSASTWAAAETIISHEAGYRYGVAANSTGRVHLAYHDPSDKGLWYRVRFQGQSGWQSRKLTEASNPAVFRIRAVHNDSSDVHVLFYDEASTELRLWSFGDFGESLRVVAKLDAVGAALDVATDAEGRAHAVYWDNTLAQLRFARHVGGTWLTGAVPGTGTEPRKLGLSFDARGDAYLAVVDSEGLVHFLRNARGVWHDTTSPLSVPDNLEVWGDAMHIASRDSNYYWEYLTVTTYRYARPYQDINCDGVPGTDGDGDGTTSVASGGHDCDDLDAEVAPGEDEVCEDESDNNCDGFVDEPACL